MKITDILPIHAIVITIFGFIAILMMIFIYIGIPVLSECLNIIAENIEEMRKEELRRILFNNLLNFRY